MALCDICMWYYPDIYTKESYNIIVMVQWECKTWNMRHVDVGEEIDEGPSFQGPAIRSMDGSLIRQDGMSFN